MSLRVGVIGVGAMGADHIRTISTAVPAARVSEVYDFDVERAYAVAQPVYAGVAGSAEALIDSSAVDAVIICSPDHTHADLAKACIAAGKPVLCEKPLAVTAEDSLSVVEAEVAARAPARPARLHASLRPRIPGDARRLAQWRHR